jgi:excisionase family DNA binding protein
MSFVNLLSVEQVAEYVGLSIYTVRRLARIGALPAAKIGRSYRFKQDDLDAYIRKQYKENDDE